MKKFFNEILEIIKEEYKFILVLLLFTVIALFPLDYYITIGGGIKNISSRIKIEDSYKEKGSFNICYISQVNASVVTYLLSYVIPNWERSKVSDYAYNSKEDASDIEYRDKIELDASTANATYYAYTEANKPIERISKKFIVIGTFDNYENNFKIGDEIISIDNKKVDTLNEFRKIVNNYPSDKIKVKIKRKNKEKELNCTIYYDDDTSSKILGISLTELNEYKTDPKVEVKFARNEEGPSGGLITALSIYNKITKKDITNSLTIAGTGTMNTDGTVGSIGGVKYKLLGASSKKADIFLVPAGINYKEAKKIKKKNHLKIKIIPVKSLNDAIKKLEKVK